MRRSPERGRGRGSAGGFRVLSDTIVFGLAALLVFVSALMVVLNRHPIYSALYLVLTFLGLSVFFLQLRAPFLAAVQVIVYAGAIMVLFLFVIMLLGEDKPLPGEGKMSKQLPVVVLFALLMAGEVGYLLTHQPAVPVNADENRALTVQIMNADGGSQDEPMGSVKAIGNTLFTDYLFAFEATSVVLLVAMVGVVVLAKKRI